MGTGRPKKLRDDEEIEGDDLWTKEMILAARAEIATEVLRDLFGDVPDLSRFQLWELYQEIANRLRRGGR